MSDKLTLTPVQQKCLRRVKMPEQINNISNQDNTPVNKQSWIKNSYVYNLSMLLFISVIFITLSFAIFPLIAANPLFGEMKYALGYSRGGTGELCRLDS